MKSKKGQDKKANLLSEIRKWQIWLADRTDPVQRLFAENQINYLKSLLNT